MPTATRTRTAALRRELARAMDIAEQAQAPLHRLALADKAVSDAKMALADFDLICGDSWKDWASTGIGPQPAADVSKRSELVAAVEAAEAMLISARYAAGSFASKANSANHHVSIVSAQLHQASLESIFEAVDAKAQEYIKSAYETARIYHELLGFDEYITQNYKDFHHNGRIAGLRHCINAPRDVLMVPGFDVKSLNNLNRFTVPINREEINRGKQLAEKAASED